MLSELRRLRLELWEAHSDRLRAPRGKALDALSDKLDSSDPNRWRADLGVLKAASEVCPCPHVADLTRVMQGLPPEPQESQTPLCGSAGADALRACGGVLALVSAPLPTAIRAMVKTSRPVAATQDKGAFCPRGHATAKG